MARKAILEKESKKAKLVKKYQTRRQELKKIIKSSVDMDAVMQAQTSLARLPINSCAARHSTRCQQCGRAHAVYRKFGLCRICLRNQLMFGNVAGGRKSSW